MMRPRESHAIKLDKCSFNISIPHQLRWIRDLHENNVGILDFTEPAPELVIEGEFVLHVREENPFNFIIAPEALDYPFTYEHELGADLFSLSHSVYVRDVGQISQWLELPQKESHRGSVNE